MSTVTRSDARYCPNCGESGSFTSKGSSTAAVERARSDGTVYFVSEYRHRFRCDHCEREFITINQNHDPVPGDLPGPYDGTHSGP